MRPLTSILAALALALVARGEATPSAAQMADRLLAEADLRDEMAEAGPVLSMAEGAERRARARESYRMAIGELRLGKVRAEWTAKLLASLTPEEITLVHRFRFERCQPIRDKLRQARAALRPLRAALAIEMLTKRDVLGDFAIEEPPSNVPESRIRLAAELLARIPAADDKGKPLENALVEVGVARSLAREMGKRWEQRMATAQAHALALWLNDDELRTYLTDLADPRLGPLLRREQAIVDGMTLFSLAEPFFFTPGPR